MYSVGSLDALSMRITTLSNSLSNLVRGLKHKKDGRRFKRIET